MACLGLAGLETDHIVQFQARFKVLGSPVTDLLARLFAALACKPIERKLGRGGTAADFKHQRWSPRTVNSIPQATISAYSGSEAARVLRHSGRRSQHVGDQGSAIVTDSSLRTALLTIRSLGRRGVRIIAAERPGPRENDLGGLSRYVERRIVVPDNRSDPEGWVEAMLEASRDHDVLMPMGMYAIGPVARRLDDFRAVTGVALPDWETINLADETPRLLDIARELQIPVPKQFSLSAYANVAALAKAATYPAIVKIGVEAGLPPAERYSIVSDAAELEQAVKRFSRYTDAPVIQEFVVGDGIGVEALYDFEHRQVAAFCHRRLREYPLSGGPSTYCESLHHPAAEAYARRLLDRLRWTGLAMVEFKIDARTSTPMLMEINPRPWGSIALPIRAGTDFPWLAYRLARDGALEAQPDWPNGVRLRYMVSDLRAAAAAFRSTDSVGERLAIIGSLLDPRVKEGILSLRDPAPLWWGYLRRGVNRILHGRALA